MSAAIVRAIWQSSFEQMVASIYATIDPESVPEGDAVEVAIDAAQTIRKAIADRRDKATGPKQPAPNGWPAPAKPMDPEALKQARREFMEGEAAKRRGQGEEP